MQIELHEFYTAAPMTDADLTELVKLLKIPKKLYTTKRHYQTGEISSLEYSFGKCKQGQSRRSAYIKTGGYDPRYLLNPETGVKCERGYLASREFVRYRPRVSVELHGSFFDNSPDFNFGRLLAFMDHLGHKPTHLDIAYNDDQGVTSLADWLPVFRNYSAYCIGNIVKKGKITPQEPDGIFNSVHIGNASSKTAYGTLYQRLDPDFMRLEMKYRSPDIIRQLLGSYDEEDREAFNYAALRELVTNLDIVTAASKRTRDPLKYERVLFWKQFLDSDPLRVSREAQREAKEAAREEAESELYLRYIKRSAGYLDNILGRYGDKIPVAAMIAEMQRIKPATSAFFEVPLLP